MQIAIDQFHSNIERVRNLGVLAQILSTHTTQALELSDLLRAELVLAVSSLDHYVHEAVRLGMLEAYRGERTRTQAFMEFRISMGTVLGVTGSPRSEAWLEQEIKNRHGHLSFQAPDRIADAIRLITVAQLWNEVARSVASESATVRERLSMIVNRRNQIVHEADMNPSYPGARWPISHQMVDDVVDFIDMIVKAIHSVISS